MFNTKNSIPEESRADVCRLLNSCLATLSDLYSQTKQAHWNVKGVSFYSLHKLFDQLASTVHEHIDPLAERVTSLGGTAEGTVRQAAEESDLPEFPVEQSGPLSYVNSLIERFAVSANKVRNGIEECEKLEDSGSADLLTAISRDLDQALWFLEAHIQK